ncbi:GNAT family N-acetyltransferase [Rhodococcus sp. IEGM 1330]|uniref:GNAT family N-acetyltransferase n=1 Tax=Rhodococcus sp. IEGM 1330 TaxID=3082225 RepID=UPI0029557939|nr:GNAT family N-acetyltransferase [Rhodococcus sp. IEGM 1330]MDV8023576.1 GNAT family N-acetyltransferase [Rhodococcus sp. IEGM 1330]
MNEVTVRRARIGDVDDLVELRAEMFRSMGSVGEDELWRAHAFDWFVDRLNNVAYGIFVVDQSGRVAACAMGAVRDAAPSPLSPDGRDVLISNVCTAPDLRGKGFGGKAFDAVMDWARQTGIARVELMATPSGRGIYERSGFTANAFPAMRARLSAGGPSA